MYTVCIHLPFSIPFAGVPSSVTFFTILWLLNGLAGGPGWPAAALIMKAVSVIQHYHMSSNEFCHGHVYITVSEF